MNRVVSLTLSCLMVLVSWEVHAHGGDPAAEDQVSFRVEAGQEVDNDRAVATMAVIAEDRQATALAATINAAMRWALDKAGAYPQVRVGSGSYQTYPVYDNKKIVRWSGRQQLQLESTSIDKLSALIGELQEKLQLQSMQFSVSPGRRQKIEDGLIEQALAAYNARAELIRSALGARAFDLVNMSVNTSGQGPVVPLRAEAAVMSSAPAASPSFEAGTSRLTVQVSATIQLRQN